MADDYSTLDLDALMPEGRIVKLNGVEYSVQPPALRVLPKLSRNLDKLAKLENTTDAEAIATALEEINETIRLVIPQLPEDANLNVAQLNALFSFILDMVTPPEQRALKEEGIQPDSPKEIGSVS